MSPSSSETDLPAVTAWFSPRALPQREGVYERRSPLGRFSCWNGCAWNADSATPLEAASRTTTSTDQSQPWRGLAASSGAPCATCRGHTLVDHGFDADTGIDRIDECPDC